MSKDVSTRFACSHLAPALVGLVAVGAAAARTSGSLWADSQHWSGQSRHFLAAGPRVLLLQPRRWHRRDGAEPPFRPTAPLRRCCVGPGWSFAFVSVKKGTLQGGLLTSTPALRPSKTAILECYQTANFIYAPRFFAFTGHLPSLEVHIAPELQQWMLRVS